MSDFKRYTPSEKAEVVLLALRSPGHVAEVCRERQIAPVTFSRWKKIYLEGGLAALNKGGPKIEIEMARENVKLKETVGHLYCELEFLKKKLGMGR